MRQMQLGVMKLGIKTTKQSEEAFLIRDCATVCMQLVISADTPSLHHQVFASPKAAFEDTEPRDSKSSDLYQKHRGGGLSS